MGKFQVLANVSFPQQKRPPHGEAAPLGLGVLLQDYSTKRGQILQ